MSVGSKGPAPGNELADGQEGLRGAGRQLETAQQVRHAGVVDHDHIADSRWGQPHQPAAGPCRVWTWVEKQLHAPCSAASDGGRLPLNADYSCKLQVVYHQSIR